MNKSDSWWRIKIGLSKFLIMYLNLAMILRILLIFWQFWAWYSYKKNSYKKERCIHLEHYLICQRNIGQNNHLHFLEFNSINKASVSVGKTCYLRILLGISSLTYIMTPPPFLFLSKRYGLENPSIGIYETGKVSSSLVSVMIKISNIPFTREPLTHQIC